MNIKNLKIITLAAGAGLRLKDYKKKIRPSKTVNKYIK